MGSVINPILSVQTILISRHKILLSVPRVISCPLRWRMILVVVITKMIHPNLLLALPSSNISIIRASNRTRIRPLSRSPARLISILIRRILIRDIMYRTLHTMAVCTIKRLELDIRRGISHLRIVSAPVLRESCSYVHYYCSDLG